MSTATPPLSDARLTRRAVRGSGRAFEAIFRRYHQELYRYCAAIVGNSADAQDAVQNTMVKVLQALPGEERRIELKPWLYRIAHNEAIEIVRRRAPGEAVDVDSLLGPANAVEVVETRDRLRRLVADVAELPERQRGALVMRELGGLGFEQIGAALGTSAATARQTLYEARLGLRAMSEGREMDCAEAMRAISDGDRRMLRGRKLRAHLRACEECREFRAAIESRSADLALLAPLPAVAAAGIMQGVAGGAAAGKSLLGATAIKAVATVGVVAAIGVTAADKGGLIHLGPRGSEVSPREAKPAPHPAASGEDRGGSPASAAPAPGAAAVRAGGAARSGPRLAGARRVGQGAEPTAVLRGPKFQPDHVAAPNPQSAAPPWAAGGRRGGPPPHAAAPPHADNGRHLGQRKHSEAAPASAGAPRGKSATAPGQSKPAAAKSAQPQAPKAEPSHTQPQHPEPPASQSTPGRAAKTPPAAADDAPPNEDADSSPTATAPAAAEDAAPTESQPPPTHGKAGAEPATP